MSVHYKFKSALDYDTVTFDGLHISVGDLKSAISQQKRIGKTSDFDLQITNAQTKEVYVDDNTLIPKNTSLLVARVPLSQQPKKQWEGSSNNTSTQQKDAALNKGLADLSRMEGSEQDKINAMITQSTFDYDPSNYQKIRGQNQRGVVPTTYTCYKCQKRGHWIKDCPTANSGDPVEIRRSTGIPRSFMVPVEGPKAPGAMMTPSGTYAVPAVDHEAYLASENAGGADTPTNAPAAPEPNIPDELICSLCRDLLTDAVMIPCCGNSFCDECIRGALLESEDHECPDCREKEIAPTTLIPNRFLRNSVSSFRNQTGYSRRTPHRPSVPPMQAHPPIMEPPPAAPMQQPSNGGQLAMSNNDSGGASRDSEYVRGRDGGSESDGSTDDNITVTVPPALTHPHSHPRSLGGPARPPRHPRAPPHRPPRYGPLPNLKPPGLDTPPTIPLNLPRNPRIDEQRASTPTIDERRDPMSSQVVYNRGPPQFIPGVPPSRRYNNPPYDRHGPQRGSSLPFNDRYPPPEPYQPPPPGIKDSPTNGHGEDPLEAFNRMIREKEMRAKRREEERRRAHSGSRSRSRSPRSVRSRPSRSPPPRSPPPRSPPPPRARPRSRGSSRLRYSRSRSISRGRLRRSPWSPRRRRTRERTLSLTRSPSPRRRHRSPLRYRSPLRSPGPRSLPRSPPRSLPRSLPRSPPRSPLRSPHRSPLRSPRRSAMRSPPPRLSPHRYTGVYDEMLSPPPRSIEPPYGSRYGNRSNAPTSMYPPMGVKPLLQLDNVPVLSDAPPAYRGRYDPPPFEDIPPGVEPPVPGFEPSPFEKPPGLMDRERLPPPNFRENYRPPPYVEGPGTFRDMPIPNVQSEIPVHVGEQRYRDNFRPYRDQGSIPFRDGQPFREPVPQGPPYRDANFRGAGPPFRDNYRNHPYRDGGFRENPPHNFRDGGAPFRPPSADPRDQAPTNYHDPNFRDGFRDENNVIRDHMRPGYRPSIRNRVGPRRNPNVEHDRHRERDGRERERYTENPDRARELEKRSGYDKSREGREGRDPREGREPREVREPREGRELREGREPREGREDRLREYERSRDYDKEREHDRSTPDKKSRASPKRNREARDKKRSESRGRSRDRESRREKREDKTRDKSADRIKEHKDKDKKMKERKKKKREKEKEVEKKKKKEKKEKKDKDVVKKEEDDTGKDDTKNDLKDSEGAESDQQKPSLPTENSQVDEKSLDVKSPNSDDKLQSDDKPEIDLYGDEAAEAVDKEIIQNYVKADENVESSDNKGLNETNKDEPFDGIELQANADELDLKLEVETNNQNKEMLAPLPELSKWEVDDDNVEKSKEPGEISSPEEDDDGGKVTSDVIKRAENAIFAKAINSLRPIEIKKISSDRLKLYGDANEQSKGSMNNIQIIVPVTDTEVRSIEINEKKKRSSKTPPPRLSVKDRLGGKVEDVRRPRESRVVHSTVERVKSRSKTPKREQPYRRVTVERDRGRKPDAFSRLDSSKKDRRIIPESGKSGDRRIRSPVSEIKKKDFDKNCKEEKFHSELRSRTHDKEISSNVKNQNLDRERKKSMLDEAHFEPDYDEHLEFDNEAKDDSSSKKRDRSGSPSGLSETKKVKLEAETIKLDLANVKKKPDSDSESSSESDYSSSSSSSDARKRKKKKKRNKKKKKRAASDSNSVSDSSSDDHKKKKKKRKHKKKSSKKKKKSKHK